MTRRQKPARFLRITVPLALVAAGAAYVLVDPLQLPGTHEVEVYALDDELSQQVDEAPGPVGRTLGMCDGDTYYAEDGDRKLCLVLSGPIGTVRAERSGGRVTVAAGEVTKLRGLAGNDPAATLVLLSDRPAALVRTADLAGAAPLSVTALG